MITSRRTRDRKKNAASHASRLSRLKHYAGTDRKALQAILRDAGFRSTEGRLKLLSILKAAARPLAISEIAVAARDFLDEANVYRALEALAQKTVIVRSDLRQRGVCFELADTHHHHLTCDDCGTSEDVDFCVGERAEKDVLRRSHNFTRIKAHSLEFFGQCRSCEAKAV
ncbi:MAG: transcriptional repressor [Candidatus Kaiserbacteria bacterium]|nr:MAG: transcriptional repressor [Candidatus Kaiserbacteria bacterium]